VGSIPGFHGMNMNRKKSTSLAVRQVALLASYRVPVVSGYLTI